MDSTLRWVLRAAPMMFWTGIALSGSGAGLLWITAEPDAARPWMPAILADGDAILWLAVIGAGLGTVGAAWTRGQSLRKKYE